VEPSPHETRSYTVQVNGASLRKKDVSRSPTGEERAHYAVELSGHVDDHWRHSFRLVQMDDTGFFRFRLDIAKSLVTFSSSDAEGAPGSSSDLMQLESLVAKVNRRASA
jgi:hypothetical protein